jgi:hypothetical protein
MTHHAMTSFEVMNGLIFIDNLGPGNPTTGHPDDITPPPMKNSRALTTAPLVAATVFVLLASCNGLRDGPI